MDRTVITSLANPLVKRARALRTRKAREESGLFLVEGIHPVGEAVAAGWELETVLYASDLLTSSFARDLIAQLGARAQPVAPAVLEALAEKENPQGLLAVARQRRLALEARPAVNSGVALVAPQDPGNLGTILRTMDAVGADALFLLNGGVDLYHPSVVRASMGTLFWIPVVECSFESFVDWARRSASGRPRLIGTSAHASVEYRALSQQTPWVLVLGNEQKGLTPEQLQACDQTVALPMRGRVSSLNLAVAAGVLLYALKT